MLGLGLMSVFWRSWRVWFFCSVWGLWGGGRADVGWGVGGGLGGVFGHKTPTH